MDMEDASDEEQGALMAQLSAGCFPCMMASGGDMGACFPAEGPPACLAQCDWDYGNCPTDCDTSTCPMVPTEGYDAEMGDNPKEGIDAYLAAGCIFDDDGR